MNTHIAEHPVYSMKDVKEKTGLSDDTLRFYEKDGILSEVKRLPNGRRQYGKQDLDWLKFVVCLRATGMPLKLIRQYRELMEQGDSTCVQRRELLLKQKETILQEIETLQKALDKINSKIGYYDGICTEKE